MSFTHLISILHGLGLIQAAQPNYGSKKGLGWVGGVHIPSSWVKIWWPIKIPPLGIHFVNIPTYVCKL